MIGRINCQAAITSFCKLNAHGSFTRTVFFKTWLSSQTSWWVGVIETKWHGLLRLLGFVTGWFNASSIIQRMNRGKCVQNIWQRRFHIWVDVCTLGSQWHCLFTFLRLLCHMLFWARFMMFSIQTAATQKETKTWSILGFFRTPCPPPRDWLKGMTGRFWRPPKPWKTYCYWEHISHINVSQPLSPDRTMHNKCDTSIQIAVCFSIFPAGLAWFGQTLLLGISKFWPPPPPASFLASSSRDFAASPCLRRIRGMPRCKGLKPRPTQNCRVWNSLKLVIWLNMIEPLTYSWNMKSVVSS